ncbi:flavin monoamine oxidase family protein [Prosthecobacter sp.]|uniref:flavin monoamine oxidase family protein n=1 Tax=Prosthecobacter sp. TaxID=1965333 RepID=UPI0037852BE4
MRALPPALSRRQMLQTTTGALLAGAVAHAAPAKKKVVIIGGGIGGLSCAYDLMERGHDVTLLEASRRTGGHVKTIYDPLPDGLYADVGAEQFTDPGYDTYREWVRKFDLPVLAYERRRKMYANVRGKWRTEEELADAKTQRDFGFNEREVAYMQEHGWKNMSRLYFGPMAKKFKDEYQPFGVGLDDLDHVVLGDWLAEQGASETGRSYCGGSRLSSKEKPATEGDVSALYRIWQESIVKMRGLPVFKREVFRLKGGNQLLPDTFAKLLGDRVRKNCKVTTLAHDANGVTVTLVEGPDKKEQTLKADYAVMCVSPLVIAGIEVAPGWPEAKKFALTHTPMGMQSRIVLQAKTRFWEGDTLPSINLETGNSTMGLVYECAGEVAGESCVLMGSGPPALAPADALAAFRKFYPGKNKDTIEQVIVHEWWKEEPLAIGCERHAFALGKLAQIWPHLIQPVGRVHFAGAAYDNLPWGQDAATRSARRVTLAIDAA